ncbi:MAG: phosphoglycolate phosphatase [Rhodobacteraceae bacterium HLUCCA08]|nr:MAG: phosphoglycolate phosphatase [Rhodobacteraceae bacterium HLUCCA08]
MNDLRLVIFDVDGTLVDSQGDILAAMGAAFAGEALVAPDRATILSVVGLSLPDAIAGLVPDQPDAVQRRMVVTYKDAYAERRRAGGPADSPLYPGAIEVLETLGRDDRTLLAIATGKSRRGLDALLGSLDLGRHFVTTQVADDHPSKPHPSMILTCLAETVVAPARAVMVGDTTYDMDMARAAGIGSIGVGWGYHPAGLLRADRSIDDFAALPAAVDDLAGGTA